MPLTATEKRLGKLVTGMNRLIKVQRAAAKESTKQNKALNKLIKVQQIATKESNKQNLVIKKQAEVVEEVTKEVYSLANAQEVLTKTTTSKARAFALAADGVGKYGKGWTMVSHILSGSPIWKLQNYFRAGGQMMAAYYNKQEKAAQITNEQSKAFAELIVHIDSVKGQMKELSSSGIKGHESLMKTNEEYKNMFSALSAGVTDEIELEKAKRTAKARTLTMYKKTHETLLKNQMNEGKALKKAIAREEKIRLKSDIKNYKRLEKEMKKASKIKNRYAEKDGDGPISDKTMEAVSKMRSTRGKMGSAAKHAIGGQGGTMKDLIKVNSVFYKMTTGPLKAMAKAAKKGSTFRKKVGGLVGVAGKVLKFAAGAMIYFLLFLVGAFLLFALVKSLFEKVDVMGIVLETLSGVFEGIGTVLDGVFDIFGAFFGEGTLGEKFSLLIGGVGKIFGGLGKILWSVFKGVLTLVFEILINIIPVLLNLLGIILKGLWNGVIKFLKWVFEPVGKFLTGIKEWFMDTIWSPIDTYIITPITEFFTSIKDFITEALDWLGGGAVGDSVGDAWDSTKDFFGFATGGITQGGLAMVGERGPELINMPKGTSVHSNDTTKGLTGRSVTNNVNVSVNGRLGASDTELRSIAKKIGSMVSSEINRSTSSSTNVRY